MANLLIVDDDLDLADGAGRPDLVILDVEMPVLTGPEMALQMFLRDVGLERIPVLLVSGVLDLPGVAQAVGTPYYLARPYFLDAWRRALFKALEQRTPPVPRAAEALHR
jgi:CheY-like chemotaxis protein